VPDDTLTTLIDRWWQVWRDGDTNAVDDLCTDPYVRHTSMGSERISRAEYKRRLAMSMEVMRGAVTTIDDQVVDGDRVWTRATSRGVNLKTDDRSVITWMVVHRIEGDRIAESWAATLPGVEWDA
jgi:hypothetical protein